jgi:hypothetical protein
MIADLAGVLRTNTSGVWTNKGLAASTAGLRLANSFHPEMWSVRCKQAHSPSERFYCDIALRRVLRRALTIWPDRYSVNPTNSRSMLRTFSKTTRVSNFRPVIAKSVIERYSRDGESVLDFSSGYSGRLLGCMTLDRSYLGIDPSRTQVRNSRKLLATVRRFMSLSGKYAIESGCAEDLLPSLRRSSFHLIFSSPPYFNLERYSKESTQSYIRYPRYGLWKERFLERLLFASARLLRDDGYLVINVANSGGYPIADDCLKIGSQILQHVSTHSILLARKPYLRSNLDDRYKTEPLFVFQKT